MKKQTFFLLMIIITTLLLKSCSSSPVLTARGTTAILQKESKYTGVDLQFGIPISKSTENRGKALALLSFGYGVANLNNNDKSLNFSNEELTAGLGMMYLFKNGRMQPYGSVEAISLVQSKSNDNSSTKKDGDLIIFPNLGIRFYMTNRFALNGSVGYQYHIVNTLGNSFNLGGIAPSFGFTYMLRKE